MAAESFNATSFLLDGRVDAVPDDRPAILWDRGALTYGQLRSEVNRCANAFRALGVEPGGRIVFILRDGPTLAAAYLGAMKAGGVSILLNWRLPPADLAAMISDIAPALVLAASDIADALAGTGAVLPPVWIADEGAQGARAWRQFVAGESDRAEPAATRADDPAYWVYTSGSTGGPKGVVHVHRDALIFDTFMRDVVGVRPGDTVFVTSKLFFAYGLAHGLLGPLKLGATSILLEGWPSAEAAVQTVARHRPRVLFSVPSLYRDMLALGPEAVERLRSVEAFVSAGERLPEAVFERWRETVGAPISEAYGCSETTCIALSQPPATARPGALGGPTPGTEVRLLDESGDPAPVGTSGVLYLRHPALSVGYWRKGTFDPSPFAGGWFCTNDVFRVDEEGRWVYVSRADTALKVAGQWLDCEDVRRVAEAVPGVTEAAIVTMPDRDGFERVALFASAPQASEAELAEIEAAIAREAESRLSRHKRPRWVRAVTELPRTATGKVALADLKRMVANAAG